MSLKHLRIFIISLIVIFGNTAAGYGFKNEAYPFKLDPGFIKCGTPLAGKNIITGTGKIASHRMDTLANSAVSGKGHFRIHYDSSGISAPNPADLDLNGVPDYIDSALVYLEYAWDLQVNQLGYAPPLSDKGAGGGEEVDIYVDNLGESGIYGVTYPDIYSGPSSAFFVIDNDFLDAIYPTKGLAALKVTTMHEFFHVVQFGYMTVRDPSWWINNAPWWMEQSATWMEDRGWDDINDYVLYMQDFFAYKTLPLDSFGSGTGTFMYGAAVWPMYLAKRFGDDQIRIIWETLGASANPSLTAMNPLIPIGLPAAFNEFAVWNYFIKDRANTRDFYPDGNLFRENMEVDLSENFYPSEDSLFISNMTSRYAELLFIGNWQGNDTLDITMTPQPGFSSENTLVFYSNPYDYQIRKLNQLSNTLSLTRTWDRAVIVTSCPDTDTKNGYITLSTNRSTQVSSTPFAAFTVKGTVPNPFNPVTTVQFTMPQSGHVEIRAYDILGRKIAELFEGELTAGEKSILWKPDNLSRGVYFINITTPYGSKTAKTLFLK